MVLKEDMEKVPNSWLDLNYNEIKLGKIKSRRGNSLSYQTAPG